MINMKPGKDANKGRGPAGAACSGQDYQSRLASILAKAGGQPAQPGTAAPKQPAPQPQQPANTLAQILGMAGAQAQQSQQAAQPQQSQQAAQPPQQPQQPQQAAQPQQQLQQAPTPAAPPVTAPAVQPSAPAQPQSHKDRLAQILAMAGKTPAQRAQAQAQQNLANNAAGILAMLQNYIQAVSQDPRKVLACDVEFSCNPGANADIYFKCYADANGNVYWDVFGDDISYVVPPRISNYQLYDDYYKGVADADFQADMATATVHSHSIQ